MNSIPKGGIDRAGALLRFTVQRWVCLKDCDIREAEKMSGLLIRYLHGDSAEFRRHACDGLRQIGPHARFAVPDLLDALAEQDTRIAAIWAVGAIAPDHPSVLRILARFLDSPDEWVRKSTVAVLLQASPRSGAATTLLAAGLLGPRADVRRGCAQALAKLGPAAREALPALESAYDDPDVFIDAVRAVLAIDPQRQATEVIRSRLENGQPARRLQVASLWLRSYDHEQPLLTAKEVYAVVFDGLTDPEPDVRAAAVALLPSFHTGFRVTGPDYYDILFRCLRDDHAQVRRKAFEALKSYSAARWRFPVSLELLLQAGKAAEPEIRAWVAEEMVRMSPNDPITIPTLISALHHENEQVRQGAVELLGSFGSDATDAVEPLTELLAKRAKPELRAAIIDTMVHIGVGAAAALAGELDNDERAVRLLALDGLTRLGPKAEPAMPELLEMLRRKDKLERQGAALALGSIGPAAIDDLLPLLREKESDVRALAALALGHVGPPARRAQTDLAGLLTDKVEEVRLRAAEALWQIGPEDAQVIASLVTSLDDVSRHVRQRAFDALVRAEERAVPALIKALAERDAGVRRRAAQALGEIGSKAVTGLSALEAAQRDPDASVRAAASAARGIIETRLGQKR